MLFNKNCCRIETTKRCFAQHDERTTNEAAAEAEAEAEAARESARRSYNGQPNNQPTNPLERAAAKGAGRGHTADSVVCGLSVQLKSVRAINNIGAFANNKQQENPTTGGA